MSKNEKKIDVTGEMPEVSVSIANPEVASSSANVSKADKHEGKAFPVTAKVFMGTYPDDKDDGKLKPCVKVALANPFANWEFEDVGIVCKWPRDKAVFKFKAKAKLKNSDDFIITGECIPSSYYSKTKKREVHYPGLFFNNPFRTGKIEFAVSSSSNSFVFSDLVSELWGGSFEADIEDGTSLAEMD